MLFTILLILTDAFFYGYCYEHRLKGDKNPVGIFNNKFSSSLYEFLNPLVYFLFREYPFRGNIYVPFYRLLIQWPLDLLALWYLWVHGTGIIVWDIYLGTHQFWGMVLAIYFMLKEYGYYAVLDQTELLDEAEEKAKIIPRKNIFSAGYTYWLERIYFAGAWLFMPYFKKERFEFSAIIGYIFLSFSNFI